MGKKTNVGEKKFMLNFRQLIEKGQKRIMNFKQVTRRQKTRREQREGPTEEEPIWRRNRYENQWI